MNCLWFTQISSLMSSVSVNALSFWFALKFKQKIWHVQNFLLLAYPLGWFHISSAANLWVPQHLPQKYSGMVGSFQLYTTHRNILTKQKQQEVNLSLFIKTGSTLHYKAVKDRTKYTFLRNELRFMKQTAVLSFMQE